MSKIATKNRFVLIFFMKMLFGPIKKCLPFVVEMYYRKKRLKNGPVLDILTSKMLFTAVDQLRKLTGEIMTIILPRDQTSTKIEF